MSDEEADTELEGGYGIKGRNLGNKNAKGKGPLQKAKKRSKSSKSSKSKKKKSHTGGSSNSKKQRFFKFIVRKTGESIGRYRGHTPKQAGSKALSKYTKRLMRDGEPVPKNIDFFIRESTRGGGKKIYGYVGTREKLKKPQILKTIDQTGGKKTTKKIVYNYRNKIRKIAVPSKLLEKLKTKSMKEGSKSTKGEKKSSKKSHKKSSKSSKKHK
jgi:hypothetical protein